MDKHPKTKEMMRIRAYQNLGHLRNKQLVDKLGMSWWISQYGRNVLAYNLVVCSKESPYTVHTQTLNRWQLLVVKYILRLVVSPVFLITKK